MLTEYKVLEEQNIFDLVNSFYGGFDNMYLFIQQNPELESIEFDFISNPNTKVIYNSAILPTTPSEIPVEVEETKSNISTIKALSQQNIFDVMAMTYGSFDNTYKLIQDNTLKSINANIVGVNFTYDNSLVSDSIIYDHINNNNISIGTGDFIEKPVLLQENSYRILLESGGFILL